MPSKQLTNPRKRQRTQAPLVQGEIEYGMGYKIAQMTISANKEVEAIADSIEAIGKEYMRKMGDVYEYAIQFDLQNEKLRLSDFWASDFIQKKLQFWSEQIDIYFYIDDKEEDLPEEKVCIKRQCDEMGLCECIKFSFKSTYQSSNVEMDLSKMAQRCAAIISNHDRISSSNHQLYYKDVPGFTKEIMDIDEQLASLSHQERIRLIATFNKKWHGQLAMTYTITITGRRGICSVEDNAGKTIFEGSHNLTNPTIAHTPPTHARGNFWQPALPNIAEETAESGARSKMT
ncbi:MAG: hypothetical protein P1U39_07370 [Legionellaceae bacterium]|nr:hypothetical protein [Legionellaceae bacterium]